MGGVREASDAREFHFGEYCLRAFRGHNGWRGSLLSVLRASEGTTEGGHGGPEASHREPVCNDACRSNCEGEGCGGFGSRFGSSEGNLQLGYFISVVDSLDALAVVGRT